MSVMQVTLSDGVGGFLLESLAEQAGVDPVALFRLILQVPRLRMELHWRKFGVFLSEEGAAYLSARGGPLERYQDKTFGNLVETESTGRSDTGNPKREA